MIEERCFICEEKEPKYPNGNVCQTCLNKMFSEFRDWASQFGKVGDVCLYADGEPFVLINSVVEVSYGKFLGMKKIDMNI